MAYPFLYLALALVSGILAASLVPISLKASVYALTACLLGAWMFFLLRKNRISFLFALTTVLFLGTGIFSHYERTYTENALRRLNLDGYADFYGTLSKSPSRGIDRDFLLVKVDSVSYQKKDEKIRGNLRVSVPHSSEYSALTGFVAGDSVKVSARLSHSMGFRNFSEPSFQRYLRSQNIHRTAFTKSPLLVEKPDGRKKPGLPGLISVLRQKLQQKIEAFFPGREGRSLSREGAILEALLLGERGRMDPDATRGLQQSGLYHLFAISGAHFAIISFFVFSVLKLLRVPTRLSYLFLIVSLLFFALLVEGRPSVFRATIMTMAFLLGKLIWKDVHLVNTIAFSAFFLLLPNPFSLFDMGFILTFSATISIILFFPKIIGFLPRLPLRISEIFILSLTAQLGVLPFMTAAFNRVTFSSLLLNYAALPLVGAIMALGYLFFPLSLLASHPANILAGGTAACIRLLTDVSRLSEYLPFLSYRIPTPPLWAVIGYFLFLGLLLFPSKFKKQKGYVFAGFALFLAVLIFHPFPSSSRNLRLTILDVGQGESMLVEFPGKIKMLVDGGGLRSETFDTGESIVSPFLWKKGIKKIDYLVLSHAHPDHMKGLKAVAKNFKIGEFWEALSPLEDEIYAGLKKSLADNVRQRRVFRGFNRQEGDVRIEVLHPPEQDPYLEVIHNELSLVLRITYSGVSFLLPGDIGAESEDEILAHFNDVHSQILKSPHHGSNTSSTDEFLCRVSPVIVVISVGEGNVHNLPNAEVLERYREAGAGIFRTDRDGAVEITTDGRKIQVRTHSGRFLSY